MKDAVYLNARGVSYAVLTAGRWDEVAPYVEFMGYTQPWYSVRGVERRRGQHGAHHCYLREGDRAFLTYSTTGRGNEPVNGSMGLLDMTPYGRGETWEDNPEGWPQGHHSAGTGARTPTGTPPGARPAAPCPSGPAPARPPWRPRPARIGAGPTVEWRPPRRQACQPHPKIG